MADASSIPHRGPGAPIPPKEVVLPSGLSLDRIIAAAVAVADRDGVEALSMRRTADQLDAGVMSLYRHVRSKEELVDLVVDAVFGGHQLPEPGPHGWRARLELSARTEWAIYRARPWMVPLVAATTRPPIAVHLMAYTDWRMRAVDGLGLDFAMMVQIAVGVSTWVQGAALALAQEDRNARVSGAEQQGATSRADAITAAFDSGRLPMVSQFGADAFRVSRPQAVFEFGLQRLLDGVAVLLGGSAVTAIPESSSSI
ncbi:AcrR family transcriptional regulator [Nakamurella sp. UYEF19]|uniref:TetR/AcrR family transcriptional regulator n=1 Tax=Nakamurella sp. UYEF19 TaxID=1756392 RepID=UPI0033973E7F